MDPGHSHVELLDPWLQNIPPCRMARERGLQSSCFRFWTDVGFQGFPIHSHRA